MLRVWLVAAGVLGGSLGAAAAADPIPPRDSGFVILLLGLGGILLVSTLLGCILAVRRKRDADSLRERLAGQEARTREAVAQASEERGNAKTADRVRSEFLANMSHELRTPLNAIIGYSEMLREEAEELGTQALVPDLDRINTAGKHLLNLIDSLLDLSKIEAGRMTLFRERFDVPTMIQEVARTVQPLMAKNDNLLEFDCADALPPMYGDLTKVRQTLFNLLSNAAKFTQHGVVRLVVTSSGAEPNRTLHFAVSDSGVGMEPEEVRRIFEPLTRADGSPARKLDASGLGLAISREFCQLMGGTLTVESRKGTGSTFRVTLPAKGKERASEVSSPGAAEASSPDDKRAEDERPMVLVVDDDAAARDLMSRALRKEGFHVETATNGREALAAVARRKPAAITLDILMPDMDGWAVLRDLKASATTVEIPVVVLTVLDDRRLGFALGAEEYLTKPVDMRRLAKVMRRFRHGIEVVRVLIVDDDPQVRRVLRRTLEAEGWEVSEAENGRAALEQMTKQPPQAILLDLLMPEMDGFALVAELQRRSEWRHVPVIVLTAKDLTAAELASLGGGVAEVHRKGAYSTDHLLRQVRRLVDAGKAPASERQP